MTEGMTLQVEVFPADVGVFVDFYTPVLRFELEVDQRRGYAAVVRGLTARRRPGAVARPYLM